MASSKIDRWIGGTQKILRDFQLQGSEIEKFQQELEVKARHLQELNAELTAQTDTVKCQGQEKELVSENLRLKCQSMKKEQELLESQDTKMDEKLKELAKGAQLFEDRLGLCFRKTSGNRLQVIFTNIDHKDPDCPFYFFLQIDNGKYIVSGCEPAVADLDVLVEKLNTTNNLHSFMVALRKRFKKLVQH